MRLKKGPYRGDLAQAWALSGETCGSAAARFFVFFGVWEVQKSYGCSFVLFDSNCFVSTSHRFVLNFEEPEIVVFLVLGYGVGCFASLSFSIFGKQVSGLMFRVWMRLMQVLLC